MSRPRLTPHRAVRQGLVYALALSAGYCVCHRGNPTGDLTACGHVDSAKKDLDTFVRNHPTNGTVDPPSQLSVLDDMLKELDAAIAASPDADIADELTQAKNDATALQLQISQGEPITSASLISDFDNLASLCGEARSSDIVAP